MPNGALDTRPRDGFRPKRPQHDAGMRIEPPPSVAWAIGTRPADDGCRRTAARSSGREIGVPGVASRSVEVGLRERDGAELGRVRLPDDHESRIADPADDGRVEVRDVVGVGVRRVRRPDARGRGEILDRDRNSAERCVGGCRVRRSRRCEGFVTADGHERVQRRIDPLDPFEAQLDELDGRRLASSNEPRLLDGREERELHRAEPTSLEKWRGPDLNRRHHGFQPCALPAELPRRGDQCSRGCR